MFYNSLPATRSLSVLTGLLDQLEAQELAAEQDAELQYAEYAEFAEYAEYAKYAEYAEYCQNFGSGSVIWNRWGDSFNWATLRTHMFYISLSATRSLSVLTGLLDQLEAEEIAAEQDAELQGFEEEDE